MQARMIFLQVEIVFPRFLKLHTQSPCVLPTSTFVTWAINGKSLLTPSGASSQLITQLNVENSCDIYCRMQRDNGFLQEPCMTIPKMPKKLKLTKADSLNPRLLISSQN